MEDCRHMCVYMDPYALMQDGVLERRSRQYAVIPGRLNAETTMIEGEEEGESDTEGEEEIDTKGEEESDTEGEEESDTGGEEESDTEGEEEIDTE
ncbi:MAG: hypothetical protein LQ338_005266, partial [Usnochroma carphineum]